MAEGTPDDRLAAIIDKARENSSEGECDGGIFRNAPATLPRNRQQALQSGSPQARDSVDETISRATSRADTQVARGGLHGQELPALPLHRGDPRCLMRLRTR